jgi:nucleoid-associated protein
MKINHIIIHELEKEGGILGAKLETYDSTIDHTDVRVLKLVNEINNRYKNKNEIYGVFDKENPTTFHDSFNSYFNDNLSETEFIKFSKLASEDLRIRIDNNAPAKGGYLIFVNYEALRKFVGVFLVRNTLGLSFNTKNKKQKNKTFNIDNVKHIDFENLAMACRINTEAYRNTEIRYLSFINSKSDEMSKYFTRWISSSDTETNQADTLLFFNLMSKIEIPINKVTGEKYDRVEFLDTIYKNVYSSADKLVNVRNLSESFFESPEFLSNYMEEKEIKINGEFKPHSTTFKKFIEINVKADKVELSFPNSIYKTIVKVIGSQIIIESENLAKAIKDRANKSD